jgi:cyclopropane fatty-acyl-phospholipid synthase-like methyltransferase
VSGEPVPERIAWAVDRLAVEPTDRILEIGCGRGVAVEQICTGLSGGQVHAIDRSATAIEAAEKRNARHVASGVATFDTVALEHADLDEGSFDKVLAINVNLFWTRNPAAELTTIRRALTPNGHRYLVYEPPTADRAAELAGRIGPQFVANGFVNRIATAHTSKGASLLALTAHVVT